MRFRRIFPALITVNAFFVAAEYALVKIRKTRVEELMKLSTWSVSPTCTPTSKRDPTWTLSCPFSTNDGREKTLPSDRSGRRPMCRPRTLPDRRPAPFTVAPALTTPRMASGMSRPSPSGSMRNRACDQAASASSTSQGRSR